MLNLLMVAAVAVAIVALWSTVRLRRKVEDLAERTTDTEEER